VVPAHPGGNPALADAIVFDEDATSVASGKRLQRLVIRRAAA